MPLSSPSQDTTWQRRARCRHDPLFITRTMAAQVEICGPCPVRDACLNFALDMEPVSWAEDVKEWPVYGGKTVQERQVMIRERRAAARALLAS